MSLRPNFFSGSAREGKERSNASRSTREGLRRIQRGRGKRRHVSLNSYLISSLYPFYPLSLTILLLSPFFFFFHSVYFLFLFIFLSVLYNFLSLYLLSYFPFFLCLRPRLWFLMFLSGKSDYALNCTDAGEDERWYSEDKTPPSPSILHTLITQTQHVHTRTHMWHKHTQKKKAKYV